MVPPNRRSGRGLAGCVLLATCVFLLVTNGRAVGQAQTFSAGAARADITPDPAMLNWVGHQPYDGVLDPIFVRALVLSEGAIKVALLTWDVVDTREGFVATVREAVSEGIGVPSTNILINASHTHSAPWVPTEGDLLVAHERASLDPVEAGHAYAAWRRHLIEQSVRAAKKADAKRRPATLAIGRAYAGDVIFNRRPRREDGKVETMFVPPNPYALPRGLRFGPMDPTLTLLWIRDAQGQTVASLFHLPCHSVCVYPFHKGISADWSGPVSGQLSQVLGGEALFLQGCAGDIVPARRGLAERDAMAQIIVERALAAATNAFALKATPLRVARKELRLPLSDAARQDTGEESIPTEIQFLGLGALALITLPGEPLIGLAISIQERSPFPNTVVLGYSNGGGVQYVGLPGEKVRGGYEMSQAGIGADGCGGLLVEAAVEMLQQQAQSGGQR